MSPEITASEEAGDAPPTTPSRNMLIRPRVVILIFIVLAGGSLLLFPDQREWRLLSKLSALDARSTTYLRLLTETQPEDSELALALMHRLIRQGELEEPQALATSLARRQDGIGQEARLALVKIHLMFANSFSATNPARRERLAQVSRALEELLQETLPTPELIQLAETSLALDRPDLAARAYERLASSDPSDRQRWLLSAARWHEASGRPGSAGNLYHAAFLMAEKEEGRGHAFKALASLQAAGDGLTALRLVETYAERYPADEEILQTALALALAQNDLTRARIWGRQLLALAPDRPDWTQKQLELELAFGDLGAALTLAQRLFELMPELPVRREQLAQIAEWAGRPTLAAEQYAWLARRQGSGPAVGHALRLARELSNGPLLIEMMTLRSRTRPLSAQELTDIVWSHERANNPQGLIDFLQSYLRNHPDARAAWERLAQVQETHGLLQQAAATWEQAGVRFGRSPETALHHAGLLIQTGQPESAFTALRPVKNVTPFDNASYWELFGDLAWNLGRKEDALTAYRGLWQTGKADPLVAERLLLLALRANQPGLAIATGEEGYQRFREPRLMFLALEAATQQRDWARLQQLLDAAGRDEPAFSTNERYWLFKAHSDSQAGRRSAALSDYDRALQLNPASKEARMGWLWLAIDVGDQQELSVRLRDWWSVAGKDPAYWGAYAAALVTLNRPKEALWWFERQARAKPGDCLWLLSYADALHRAGQESEAWRLRRHVLLQIRREGLSARSDGEPTLRKAHATLLNDFAGADAGGKAIRGLLIRDPDDPQAREMLIAHHLSAENYAAARYWLLRAHSERQITPAWQRLSVAFADGDMKAVEQLLDEGNLAPGDRIEALRRLGRDKEALTEVREYASRRRP